jgi:GNAT superfamily N-acetyltransferase
MSPERHRAPAVVRQATAQDAAALAGLVEKYWRFECIDGFDPTVVHRNLVALLDDRRAGTGWVAWDADSPVGYLLAVFVFSLENGGLTAEIDEFFVLESHRGRGIGAHLLATCERYLNEAGCTNVALQLARNNDAAREFYRRNGYAPRNGYELLEKDLGCGDS